MKVLGIGPKEKEQDQAQITKMFARKINAFCALFHYRGKRLSSISLIIVVAIQYRKRRKSSKHSEKSAGRLVRKGLK